MPKRIMFTGPHAIGKSSTAKKLADINSFFIYVPSVAGLVAKYLGYDLNDKPSLQQTFDYQVALLDALVDQYKGNDEDDVTYIYDRSPIDLMVYMTMAFAGKEDMDNSLFCYFKECYNTLIKYCTLLVLPQADLSEPYENKPNRPIASNPIYDRVKYSEMVDAVLKVPLLKDLNVIRIPKEFQYDTRVNFLKGYLGW